MAAKAALWGGGREVGRWRRPRPSPLAALFPPPPAHARPPPPPPRDLTVVIGGLPPTVTDADVDALLAACDARARWRRVADPVTDRPAGYGLAAFETPAAARAALALLDGAAVDGRTLVVRAPTKARAFLAWEAAAAAAAAEAAPPGAPPPAGGDAAAAAAELAAAPAVRALLAARPAVVDAAAPAAPRPAASPPAAAAAADAFLLGLDAGLGGGGAVAHAAAARAAAAAARARDALAAWEDAERRHRDDADRDAGRAARSAGARARAAAADAEPCSSDDEPPWCRRPAGATRAGRRRARARAEDEAADRADRDRAAADAAAAAAAAEADEAAELDAAAAAARERAKAGAAAGAAPGAALGAAAAAAPARRARAARAAPMPSVFGDGEDGAQDGAAASRRPLKKLAYTEEERAAVDRAADAGGGQAAPTPHGDTKAAIRAIIASIPTDAGAVFDAPIDWAAYDARAATIAPRARRWVAAKTVALLGEEEMSFVDHVMSLVAAHAGGAALAADVARVLDDDAGPFAVGLLRLLLLETRKAAAGLL